MATPQDIAKQLKSVVSRLTVGQKIGAALVALTIVGGIIAGSIVAGRPDWRLLSQGLSPKDGPKIMAKLEEVGIAYDLSTDQSSIFVDAADMKEARKALARSGVIVSEEDMDDSNPLFKSSLSKNELIFTQTRELERRLSQKLMKFDFIEYAAVTISPAMDKYFKQGRTEAKASVQVKPTMLLSPQQTDSIAHIVAGGVERLSAEQVAIVDATTGLTLRQPAGDGAVGVRPQNFAYAHAIERHKEMQAQEKLDLVYGVRRVVVSVAADIDWDRLERTETKYDPDSGVTLEKESVVSSRVGESKVPGGRVGASAAANGSSGAGKGTESKDSTIKESKRFNQTETAVIKAGGAIKRLSVGVFVDASLQGDVENIKNTVSAAIGIDKARGDSVEVLSTAFAPAPENTLVEEREGAERWAGIMQWIEYGLIAAFGAAFIIITLKTMKRARANLREVLEQSIVAEEESKKEREPSLEEAVLTAATNDVELAGRSLKRWLYEAGTR